MPGFGQVARIGGRQSGQPATQQFALQSERLVIPLSYGWLRRDKAADPAIYRSAVISAGSGDRSQRD
jgi:hypothetical protein